MIPEYQIFFFIVGALCYVGYFHHGEHHMYGVKYIQIQLLAIAAFTTLLYRRLPLREAISETLMYDGIFLAGIFASLFVYRAFLNPLNAFSGPWLARISSFYMTFNIRGMQMYKTLQNLHEKHGYFVRIGTGELSITHPHAQRDIFGPESVCEKGPWYDISRPQDSVLLRRTFAGHAELRSVWSQAFSVKAVKSYEVRIHPYRTKLIAELDAHAGQPLAINHWLGLYSWDVLSDLSFGHSFGMLDTKEKHWAMNVLDKGMSIIGHHFPMWFLRTCHAIPGGNKDLKFMLDYCKEEMVRRWEVRTHSSLTCSAWKLTSVKQSDPKLSDVMGALFVPYRKGEKTFDAAAIELLAGEAHLLVNAGR